MQSMAPVVLIMRDILLLRRGPQDLPYSTQLLAAVAVAGVAVQALACAILLDVSALLVLFSACVSVSLTLLALNLLLGMRKLRNRFVQSATALVTSNLLFTIINIPALLILPTKPTSPEQMPLLALLLAPLVLACEIWQIAVSAHILRHTLDIPTWMGVAIVLLWVFIAVVLTALSGGPALV